MSAISHLYVTEEERRRAHDVVGRHKLPDFVSGYRIEFGEFDGDPALWVLFEMRDDLEPGDIDAAGRFSDGMKRRIEAMTALKNGVQSDLLDIFMDRFPYVRYVPVPEVVAH